MQVRRASPSLATQTVPAHADAEGCGQQGAAAGPWALSGLISCSPTGEAALKERVEQNHQACEAAQSALPAQQQAER